MKIFENNLHRRCRTPRRLCGTSLARAARAVIIFSTRRHGSWSSTGRELWTRDKSFGKYMSLVAQGDRILALDQRGELFLLRANKERFDLLDQRKLGDSETWAHLAAAGDELFVRELNALTAYRWHNAKDAGSKPETKTP